jgi:fatty-acyl-CoA synthase
VGAPPETGAGVGVGSWFERRARIAPERTALVWGDRAWTYAEVADRVRRLANGLRALGVRRGDRVGWLGENHPSFLEVLSASALLGAAVAPVNHRLEPATIAHVLADSAPSALLTDRPPPGVAIPESVKARISWADAVPGAVAYERLIAEAPAEPIDEPISPDDLCILPYSSGTTGRPKGIMQTHRGVTSNVVNFLSCVDFRGDDVTVAMAPFFRTGGFGVNVLPVLFRGGTVVIPTTTDPARVLDLLERHRVTVGFGNPDLLQALLSSDRWSKVDLSSLRMMMTGGAPVHTPLVRAYLDRGIPLVPGYGLSEASPLVLIVPPDVVRRKPGAAGRPPLLVDVRIVGPDLRDVEMGRTGELLARGPNVMAGYWNDPEATARTVVNGGWLRTGDAARMDEDGDVWIVDRIDDGYRSAEGLVFPGDVERALVEHPAVADAGVVGIDGADGLQTGIAFVVVRPGAPVTKGELVAFCRDRLGSAAEPGSVVFVEAIPRNSVGKLLRGTLRERAASLP